MNCKIYRNNMIGYIKGQLPAGELARISHHLDQCQECRTFASYLNNTLSVIKAEREIEPDPFLATRIEGILQSYTQPKSLPVASRRLIPALAFTFFILAGIFGGYSLGKLISTGERFADESAANELVMIMDELRQEPIEAFLMEME